MKKIFTLLFAVGFLTAANAQPGSRDNHQYDQRNDQPNGQWDKSNGRDVAGNNDRYGNDDRYDKGYGSYGRDREMQIAQINRRYDFKIQQVRNDFFMRRYEKRRVISSLEEQRQQEIRMLYVRSGNNRDWHHDRGYDSNHH
jgi:hypothetical protein